MTAGGESPRPRAGSLGRFRPRLAHQGGDHTGLRQRRFADTGIPKQDRQLVGCLCKRPDHLGGFTNSAEEEVRIGLGHRVEAAIGRGVAPQFLRRRRPAAGRRVHHLDQALLGGRVAGDDPVQLPQKGQPRRGLTVEQYQHDREIVLLYAAVERLVVLHRLPRPDAPFRRPAARRPSPRRSPGRVQGATNRRPAGSSGQRRSLHPGPYAADPPRGSRSAPDLANCS